MSRAHDATRMLFDIRQAATESESITPDNAWLVYPHDPDCAASGVVFDEVKKKYSAGQGMASFSRVTGFGA